MAIDVGTIEAFGFGLDPIVIRKYVAGIQGGKVLDVSDYSEEYVRAGHVIIHDTTADTYKPLGVSEGAYVALPDGCEYAGVCTATKSVKCPFVGIMYSGEVNDVASPYAVDDIKEALKTALPTLVYLHD